MTDRQNFIGDIDRPYYWASEVPKLVGPGTPSLSTFYRYAREGKVNKIDIQGPEDAYSGEDVKKFLRGELSGRRKSTQQKQRVEKPSPDYGSVTTRKQELVVDVAKQSDLLPLYMLESDQLDLLRAIVPPVLHGWLHVNDHAYWVLSSPINRQEILAMLGVLPLREETIQKLLCKEILPSQILPSDVLSYKPGGSYSCYITSAAARSEHRDTVLLLVERLFAYWREQSIEIEAIFASVDEGTDDNIPLLHIVTQCFFILLDEQGQWRLRPLHRKNHPVSFIRNYRECIEQRKREQKKEGNSMFVIDSPVNSLDTLRRLFERKLAAKGDKDFSEVVHAYIKMDADGNITRKDGSSQHKVWVGPIRNDDDIRATLRINASLFGASQKFTEDQLVSFRQEWLKKNHDIYRILEVDGEVVGFIFAMPLPMPVIDRFLNPNKPRG